MEQRQAVAIDLLETSPQWDATQARILDAADELIRRRGVHGVTVAALSRRAERSRPTIYRSWTDADDVVRAALLRRVTRIIEQFPTHASNRRSLVDDVLRFSSLFRSDAVYSRLLADEPEVFMRYTLHRVGSSQRMILRWLARAIHEGQQGGTVRLGEPQEIAVMLLLVAQSAVLSHGTVSELISEESWERELRTALDGLLRP